MLNLSRCLVLLLSSASFIQLGVADKPVAGPPTWIVDAQVKPDGPRGQSQLVGTIFRWGETRQNWTDSRTFQRDGRSIDASAKRSRAVIALNAEEFAVSLTTLQLARLDGSTIESNDLSALLEPKRAIAFLSKGTSIHPAIAAVLHPETIVATRVSYPNDPVVVPLGNKR